MNKIKTFGLLLTFLGCSFSHFSGAKSVTDELIVALVDKNLPKILYTEKHTPWKLGFYDLTVKKRGVAAFSSTPQYLSLTLPIEVVIKGQVNRSFLGSQIIMNCSSTVLTETRLDVEPIIKAQQSHAKVEISVPVPPSQLNCEGFKVSITPLLQAIVAKEKQKWQGQLEQDIQGIFKKLGL